MLRVSPKKDYRVENRVEIIKCKYRGLYRGQYRLQYIGTIKLGEERGQFIGI